MPRAPPLGEHGEVRNWFIDVARGWAVVLSGALVLQPVAVNVLAQTKDEERAVHAADAAEDPSAEAGSELPSAGDEAGVGDPARDDAEVRDDADLPNDETAQGGELEATPTTIEPALDLTIDTALDELAATGPDGPLESGAPASDELAFDDLSSMSLEALLSIELTTGSLLELDRFKSVISLTVIDRDQIRASGARHLSELLEIYVPGFQYMLNRWNGPIWGLRGVTSDRNTKVVFMINGQKLNLESSHGNYTELTLGLMGDIERVEVMRGPAGLVWGSGSIAGAVNVVTRMPTRPGAEVRAAYGTMGDPEVEASAGTHGPLDGHVRISFGARKSDGLGLRTARIYGNHEWPTDGVVSPDGRPTDGTPWATPANWRLSLDWTLKPSDVDRVRLYTRFTRVALPTGDGFIVDPFPEYGPNVPADAPPRIVDGETVDANHPLAGTESFGTNRRLHIVTALSFQAEYARTLGNDELRASLQFAGVSDAMVADYREGYDGPDSGPPAGATNWSFGERRTALDLRYLGFPRDELRWVAGAQYRLDDIGESMLGRTAFGGSTSRYYVEPVRYHNVAAFSEGYWEFTDWMAADVGLRLDKHTRTTWVANPRAGVVFQPHRSHSIRALVQSAANNGQADFYERNWTSFDAAGNIVTQPYLENPQDPTSSIVRRATLEEQRSLKPERALSVELNSLHQVEPHLTLAAATAWTRYSNLFAWNSDLFRIVNAGTYATLSVELEAQFHFSDLVRGGISHRYARVVQDETNGVPQSRPATMVVDSDGDGNYEVVETPGVRETFVTNAVRDQVTVDGKRFINLSDNVTKLHLTVTPLDWLSLHTNVRAFWGLPGRAELWREDLANGENYLGTENWLTGAMFKIHCGVQVTPLPGLSVALYLRDLLGSARSRHAVRWQQSAAPVQRGLFTTDQRSAQLELTYTYE